jgi:hypothetical protein
MKKSFLRAGGFCFVLGLLVFVSCTPKDPGDLRALYVGAGRVSLYWTDPEEKKLDHIEISFSPEAEGVAQPVSAPRGVQTAVIDGLDPAAEYTFTLRALTESGKKSKGVSPDASSLYEVIVGGREIVEGKTVSSYWRAGAAAALKETEDGEAAVPWKMAVSGADVYFLAPLPAGRYWEEYYNAWIPITKPALWKNGEVLLTLETGKGDFMDIAVDESGWYLTGQSGGKAVYWKNGEMIPLTDGSERYSIAGGIALAEGGVYIAGNYGGPRVYARGHDEAEDWRGRYGGTAVYWKDGEMINLEGGSAAHDIAVDGGDVYVSGAKEPRRGASQQAVLWKNGEAAGFLDQLDPGQNDWWWSRIVDLAVVDGNLHLIWFGGDAERMRTWKTRYLINGEEQPERPENGPLEALCRFGPDVFTAGTVSDGTAYSHRAVLRHNGEEIPLSGEYSFAGHIGIVPR